MAIDLPAVFDQFKVEYETSGSELSKGWIGFACPWCNDSKSHMGYSTKMGMFTCWRCGVKNQEKTLNKILNIPFGEVKKVVKAHFIPGSEEFSSTKKKVKEISLPNNHGCLKKEHKQYLKGRGFSTEDLRQWDLVGSCDKDYPNRILIPIYYQGRLVSFTSRDITGKAKVKAKNCPQEKEGLNYKKTLYGMDYVKSNTIIVSEGPFDAWRWGNGGVATFGVKVSQAQLDLIKCFKNIFICFDGGPDEEAAQEKAEEIADRLSVFQNVWVIDIGCDPSDLTQKKANKIKKHFHKIVKENEKEK